jgi:hypothetical protein
MQISHGVSSGLAARRAPLRRRPAAWRRMCQSAESVTRENGTRHLSNSSCVLRYRSTFYSILKEPLSVVPAIGSALCAHRLELLEDGGRRLLK